MFSKRNQPQIYRPPIRRAIILERGKRVKWFRLVVVLP